jgi:hypothetical protein
MPGVWAVDQSGGMAVENYKFDEDQYDVFDLQRYDLVRTKEKGEIETK